MSFYGNSYFYTADTFARVILQNAGIDISTVPNLAEIIKDKVYLDSHKRDAGLGISSGNRWITLKQMTGADQGFEIWHNAPRTTGEALNMVISDMEKKGLGNPPDSEVNVLDFEDYIKIPTFYYDETGHVSAKNQMIYFKLPENPMDDATSRMDDIEARMKAIDGLDADGNDVDTAGTSLKKSLEKQMANNLATIQQIEKNVNNKYSEMSEAITKANDAFNLANSAMNDVEDMGLIVDGVKARLKAIEEKLGM